MRAPFVVFCLVIAPLLRAAPDEAVESFDTCESIVANFRAFHGDAFPHDKWKCEDGVLHSMKGRRVDLVTRDEYELQFSEIFGQITAYAGGTPINVVNPKVLESAAKRV